MNSPDDLPATKCCDAEIKILLIVDDKKEELLIAAECSKCGKEINIREAIENEQ